MAEEFQVSGKNAAAPFTLKLHRGDGMSLIAMNWKKGKPPKDFVGFAIEYREPNGDRFFPLKNRLAFPGTNGDVNPNKLSTRLSPIQKFRWVHFPRFAELKGKFLYRVTPVFMNSADELSYGEPQEAAIELASAAPQKGRRKAVVERRLYEQAPRAGSRAVFVGAPISAPDCDAAERDCRDLGLDGGDVRR